MKFEPRHDQILGRTVTRKSKSEIILPDGTKVSKLVFVDAVGDQAAAAGIKVGDIVVPVAIGGIVLDRFYRPTMKEAEARLFVRGATLSDFLVQTESGDKYVPFDSPDAAKSLGYDKTVM